MFVYTAQNADVWQRENRHTQATPILSTFVLPRPRRFVERIGRAFCRPQIWSSSVLRPEAWRGGINKGGREINLTLGEVTRPGQFSRAGKVTQGLPPTLTNRPPQCPLKPQPSLAARHQWPGINGPPKAKLSAHTPCATERATGLLTGLASRAAALRAAHCVPEGPARASSSTKSSAARARRRCALHHLRGCACVSLQH